MKRKIKITESDLHNIIKESVNKILKENNENSILQNKASILLYEYWKYYRDLKTALNKLKSDLDESFIDIDFGGYTINDFKAEIENF